MFRPARLNNDDRPTPPPPRIRRSRGGRRRQFTAEQHMARGTYREDRHGPLPHETTPPITLAARPAPLPRRPAARWIRGPADLAAAEAGYLFDPRQGAYACHWIETHLHLVEGIWSGRPFTLLRWQRDYLYRLFGWYKFHEEWGRQALRYRRSLVMVAKKNGKSPFAAAIALLLAYGFHQPDQIEFGSEVLIVAKDKIQTENIFKHCRRMVKTSPALTDSCAINDGTCRILHTPTDTLCRAMAHDPDQLEGLNPRALVCDELHVWKNQRVWDAIRFAGASRPDFLLLAITTAGDDRQSLCYSQYEYGKQVNAGHIIDHELLPVIYEADPDDDWTRPSSWRKANPSLGAIVQKSELRAACTEAKHNARLQAPFRRYRLNVWTQPEAAWLDSSYWADCAATFNLESGKGYTACLGLDLARTRDLTAAVVTWLDHVDDQLYVWPMFWLPEQRARQLNHLVPMLEWAEAGYLRLVPGETTDYAAIYHDIEELTRQVYIANVLYDPWSADAFTLTIEQNLGLPRLKFPQTLHNFTGPAKEFERRILNGTLSHPANPVLTWQVGHCLVYTDPNGNIRPVRRETTDHRTIDGIVATLMSVAQTLREQPQVPFCSCFTLD
jgi:phage terminase large subunit-like protein